MHMFFWLGCDLGELLFSGLTVDSAGAMVTACLLFALLAITFEGLKLLEARLRCEQLRRYRHAQRGPCSDDRSQLLAQPGPSVATSSSPPESPSPPPAATSYSQWVALLQVLLFSTNTSLNYFIMLGVMLYNAYIALAAVLGLAAGYYVFGHTALSLKLQSVEERSGPLTVCRPDCREPGAVAGSTPPLAQLSRGSVDCCDPHDECCESPDKGMTGSAACCDLQTQLE